MTPTPRGLADLQHLLELDFADPTANGQNGAGGNPSFTLTGHSSSLVAHSVSAINPRAIVFRNLPPVAGSTQVPYVMLAYARGEEFVELANFDPVGDGLAFYLVRFTHSCNDDHSCTWADLLTPSVEKNWTSATLYEENEGIRNTVFDCVACHMPAGGNPADKGPFMLRMQENSAPYTHFFSANTAGGAALLADYHKAHLDENYGPIPGALIDKSDPKLLADFVAAKGYGNQPNAFPSQIIEAEVSASSPQQPANNTVPGQSPTWDALYQRSLQGEVIPPPYHDVKVTDQRTLDFMTTGYRDVVEGRVPPEWLPDIRQVFLTEALPDLSFAPAPGLDGHGLLVQVCQQCHHDGFGQDISKSHFDVTKLDSMDAAESQKAIERMNLPDDNPHKMPPIRFRRLSKGEIERITTALAP
jgi:hypothetical protein